tara:strand:- start:265 stop:453 length:189 start_codon:yes stop_codon:yes gene_type:complete
VYINKENKSYIYGYTDKTKNVTEKQSSEKSQSTYKGGGGGNFKKDFSGIYNIIGCIRVLYSS